MAIGHKTSFKVLYAKKEETSTLVLNLKFFDFAPDILHDIVTVNYSISQH